MEGKFLCRKHLCVDVQRMKKERERRGREVEKAGKSDRERVNEITMGRKERAAVEQNQGDQQRRGSGTKSTE